MAGTGSRKGISYKMLPSRRNWVLNAVPVLLIHCDGVTDATGFTDSGPTGHTVTANGTAKIGKTGKFCQGLSLDGDSDYLSLADHANWDLGTNTTIDFWARHTGAINDIMTWICQYEDVNNQWCFRNNSTGEIIDFEMWSGGDRKVLVSSAVGTDISDSDWHHLAMCKVGEEYGIYKNGTQIAHTSDADTDTFAGSLYIGANGAPANYNSGLMDEIRIVHSNPFGAAPVVGLTDTIAVPCKPYISWS